MSERSIVLASASPRRRELLRQIGITPSLMISSDIDETPVSGELPTECVIRLACSKAKAVSANYADSIVLAADTLVVCDDVIMGKPESKDHAFSMWRALSGRWHQVLTAVAMVQNQQLANVLNISEVKFSTLSEDTMAVYWSTGEPADKAGAYAIQGMAAVWVSEIKGSYSGIMGLPLFETSQLLAQAGVKIL